MRKNRRKWILLTVLAVLLAAAGVAVWVGLKARKEAAAVLEPLAPEAPPDLEKFRDTYMKGVKAFEAGDAGAAATTLSSFTFGPRAVDQYRLYYLGRSCAAINDHGRARVAFAHMLAHGVRAVAAEDAGTRLAAYYAGRGAWKEAAMASAGAASASRSPARARWSALEAHFLRGSLPDVLDLARSMAVEQPASDEATSAVAVLRSIGESPENQRLPLTFEEKIQRAAALARDGKPALALVELDAMASAAPASKRDEVALQRGLSMAALRRYEDSNAVLEPLTAGEFGTAIPALRAAARNYRILSDSIDPKVKKTITVRQRVGTRKVRVGQGKKARFVTRPKFGNVKKTVELVDLAKKAKKDEYSRLASERLRDLLQLEQTPADVRVEVLNALIPIAEAKNQDDYLREIVPQLIKLDRWADPALQHFWDKAWTAFTTGDLRTARPLLRFIADTYNNPNVKRQAEYWFARATDRSGDKASADRIYEKLAAAPYEDLYALHARSRGAQPARVGGDPMASQRPDWSAIAENGMPPELRLAHELTALTHFRQAEVERIRNGTRANRPWSDALLAQKLADDGNLVEMYRAMKRAFPLIATVEQDSVPPYFLKMYYPIKHQETIRENAAKHRLDPHLVMALILQESYYNPKARSPVGATGLMQIMPATGAELGRRLHGRFSTSRLTDPETNIELGTFHLRNLFNLFGGKTELVVAAYNAGQGNVQKWRRGAPRKPMDEFLESIPFAETRNYVKRVTLLRSSYSRITK